MANPLLPCPVQLEFVGIIGEPCGEPTSVRVTRSCANKHTDTKPMCERHVRLLLGPGAGTVACATCHDENTVLTVEVGGDRD